MVGESLSSDTANKRVTSIVYLVGKILVVIVVGFLIFCLLAVHGDGWVRPTIRVQVSGTDGSPIEEATVIFFDREGMRDLWLATREANYSTEDLVHDASMGTTNGHGQAEVKGSFGAVFYLWHTYLGGRGILRVEKPGYLPVEMVIDSRERRREILDELLEFDITLKQ